jgi:hypothetical protein
VLALALAKCALETARWKSIWCFNFGNIKASATYIGSYCTIELNEVIGGKTVWFSPRGRLDRKGGTVVAEACNDPPGHPQTRMRAYGSAIEGTRAYVDFVASGRYAAAWQRLLAGDAAGYVHALKVAGYFTADEAQYLRGVASMQSEFVSKLKPTPPPLPPRQTTPSLMPTLRLGASGPDVVKLQERLNAHGAFPKVVVDGNFGTRTGLALRIFQQTHKLIADQIAGPRVWAALLADPKPGTDPAPAA